MLSTGSMVWAVDEEDEELRRLAYVIALGGHLAVQTCE